MILTVQKQTVVSLRVDLCLYSGVTSIEYPNNPVASNLKHIGLICFKMDVISGKLEIEKNSTPWSGICPALYNPLICSLPGMQCVPVRNGHKTGYWTSMSISAHFTDISILVPFHTNRLVVTRLFLWNI